jgi:hypothetical protein
MISVLLTLAGAAISFAERPDVQQAAIDVLDLVTAGRTALDAVIAHSPGSATDAQFQDLDARCKALEDRVQAAALEQDPNTPAS